MEASDEHEKTTCNTTFTRSHLHFNYNNHWGPKREDKVESKSSARPLDVSSSKPGNITKLPFFTVVLWVVVVVVVVMVLVRLESFTVFCTGMVDEVVREGMGADEESLINLRLGAVVVGAVEGEADAFSWIIFCNLADAGDSVEESGRFREAVSEVGDLVVVVRTLVCDRVIDGRVEEVVFGFESFSVIIFFGGGGVEDCRRAPTLADVM
jgi:hypothetical protein